MGAFKYESHYLWNVSRGILWYAPSVTPKGDNDLWIKHFFVFTERYIIFREEKCGTSRLNTPEYEKGITHYDYSVYSRVTGKLVGTLDCDVEQVTVTFFEKRSEFPNLRLNYTAIAVFEDITNKLDCYYARYLKLEWFDEEITRVMHHRWRGDNEIYINEE